MALRNVKPVTLPTQRPLGTRGNEISPEQNITKVHSVGATMTFRHAAESPEWLKQYDEILPSTTSSTKGAALSIVNNKNGKRVKVATSILKELGFPNAVRFLVHDDSQEVYILAAKRDEVAHNLAGKPTKNMVYSARLVERLTLLFELDYSSRTSHSVGTWTVTEEEGIKMIGVRLVEEVQEKNKEIQEEQQEQEPNEETHTTTPFSESVAE